MANWLIIWIILLIVTILAVFQESQEEISDSDEDYLDY